MHKRYKLLLFIVSLFAFGSTVFASNCALEANDEDDCKKCSGYEWNGSKCVIVNETTPDTVKSDNKVSCGNIKKIPKKIPKLTSDAVKILQVAVPVILILFGIIDMLKGIASQKEDEIKKGQNIFIKRLIIAIVIFFIVAFVKLLISVVDGDNKENIASCIDCFINNDCK